MYTPHAIYNKRVWELLDANATEQEDLLNMTDLKAVAERVFFAHAPMNLLSEQARENFIVQFTLHYMQNELTHPTLNNKPSYLWYQALNEKLYNNSDRINEIYKLLTVQCYKEYEKREKSRQANHVKNTIDNSSKSNESASQGTGVSSLDKSTAGKETNINNEEINRANNITNATNLTDINNISKEESKSDNLSGTTSTADQSAISKSDENTNISNTNNGSTDVTSYGKTSELTFTDRKDTHEFDKINNYIPNHENETDNVKTYTTTSTKSIDGSYKDTNSNKEFLNNMQLQFDTPQGTLSDLANPGGNPGGQDGDDESTLGVNYAHSNSYNYFSSAAEGDSTTRSNGETERTYTDYAETTEETFDIDGTNKKDNQVVKTRKGSGTTTVDNVAYEGDVTHDKGKDELSKDGSELTTAGGEDSTTSTGASVTASNGATQSAEQQQSSGMENVQQQASSQTGGSETGVRNSTEQKTTAGTDATNKAAIENRSQDIAESQIKSDAKTEQAQAVENTTAAGTEQGQEDGTEEEIKYKINLWEFESSINPMSEIWKIFDPLFLQIYSVNGGQDFRFRGIFRI